MLSDRHNERRYAALALYERFCAASVDFADGIGRDLLAERAHAIAHQEFHLAVVGEVKAGKSTLINALLGAEILPTDALQSTSAIIEICSAPHHAVIVTFGDGHVERRVKLKPDEDPDLLNKFLRQVGAVDGRYKNIPVDLIDSFLVERLIPDADNIPITALEHHSEIRNLARYGDEIREYVRGRSLAAIPVSVRVEYPLPSSLAQLRIVDTPGVHAVGGLQRKTLAYLVKADALLVVHAISAAIESVSFQRFVQSISAERDPQSIFLALSHISRLGPLSRTARFEKAARDFESVCGSKNVFAVDSLLQLIADDLRRFDSPDALGAEYEREIQDLQARDVIHQSSLASVDAKLNELQRFRFSEGRGRHWSQVADASQFETLTAALAKFAQIAPALQLDAFVASLRIGYANRVEAYAQSADLLEKKQRAPETFQQAILALQGDLKRYELEVAKISVDHLKGSASARDFKGDLERSRVIALDLIKKAVDEASIRAGLGWFGRELRRLFAGEVAAIREEAERRVHDIGKETGMRMNESIRAPRVDVDAIATEAREAAYREIRVKVDSNRGAAAAKGGALTAVVGGVIGFIFGGPVGAAIGAGSGLVAGGGAGYATGEDEFSSRKVFSEEEFVKGLKRRAGQVITQLVEETVPAKMDEFVVQFRDTFIETVSGLSQARRLELEELAKAQLENESLAERIRDFRARAADAEKGRSEADDILASSRGGPALLR